MQWARGHFGKAELGDARRTRRLIAVAAMMATRPEASLPKQMVDWSDIKAAYRLFDCEEVTFEAVSQPHYGRRHDCGSQRCLIINDTTEINFTKHREIPGLGFLGKGQGYGFLLHSALMLLETGQVLGLAGQKLICRRRHVNKPRQTRTQALRHSRELELPTNGGRWVKTLSFPARSALHVAESSQVYSRVQREAL